MIDADATIKYLREFRCKDCDRRKGIKNGKMRFCYEIGGVPCRACDIGDSIDYFLDEDISPTVDAVSVVRCKDCKYQLDRGRAHKECDKHFLWAKDDWFCADGERRTD